MKHTFEESLEILKELGFELHSYSSNKEAICCSIALDRRFKTVDLYSAYLVYFIDYNVVDDLFELKYITEHLSFTLNSGEYSNIDRCDIGIIMHDFFRYCYALQSVQI